MLLGCVTETGVCQYEHLLERAGLPALSERRKRAKLCHLFKIIHELTDCQFAPVHTKMPSYDTRQVANLSLQDHTSQFLFTFYPHSISLWNSLPPNIQTISSLHTFKQSFISKLISLPSPYYILYSTHGFMLVLTPLLFMSTTDVFYQASEISIDITHQVEKNHLTQNDWVLRKVLR